MKHVYILSRHPRHPYAHCIEYLKAGEVMGVYDNKQEPAEIMGQKNARKDSLYLWQVTRKTVKESQK